MTQDVRNEAELLDQLRTWLQLHGEVGEWLLATIDEAIDTGVEHEVTYEEDDDFIDPTGPADMFGAPTRSRRRARVTARRGKVTGIESRLPVDPSESLRIHLRVLRAYLVALPRCIASTQTALRDLNVQDSAIVLAGSMSAGALGRELTAIHVTEMIGYDWEAASQYIESALRALDAPAEA